MTQAPGPAGRGRTPSGARVRHRGRRSRRWTHPAFVSAVVLAAVCATTYGVVHHSSSSPAHAADSPADAKAPATTVTTPPTTPATTATTPPATTTPAPTTPAAPTAPPAKPAAEAKKALDASVKALSDRYNGRLSVAVTELDGKASASYADSAKTYDTASIVKVDILATLLLRHQKAGTKMTSAQKAQAARMIRQSDNDAATALWHAIGRTAGLDSANRTFGLKHTAGGAGDLWGLTQTTAADQLVLLRVVFGDDSPLTSASRSYMRSLMSTVATDQRWGVSAADEDGKGFALKNGWLPRSATGLWDVNSIGEVEYRGHTLLVSVMSSGNTSEATGIKKVEAAAEAAAKSLY